MPSQYAAGASGNGYIRPSRGFGNSWDQFVNHIEKSLGLKGIDVMEKGLSFITPKHEQPWFLYLGFIDTHVADLVTATEEVSLSPVPAGDDNAPVQEVVALAAGPEGLRVHAQGGFVEVSRVRLGDGAKVKSTEVDIPVGTILGG